MGSIKEHFVAKYKDDVNRTLYMFLEKEKGAAAGSNSLIVLNKQFYVGGYKEQFVRHLIYDLSTIQKTIKRIVLSFFLKFCNFDKNSAAFNQFWIISIFVPVIEQSKIM